MMSPETGGAILSPMPPAFEMRDTVFAYPDGTLAVAGVSLEIPVGDQVALLGANGSGKSTLLRLLAGLAHPSSGSVRAFGAELTRAYLADAAYACSFRRRVGIVFQNSDAQLFCPTVEEELAFGPLQMGIPVAEVRQRVADLAAMLGLQALLDRPPFRLSGGEKKRVAIGAVLSVNPEALLLDEPTMGLDPRSQHWLVHLIGELSTAGKTIVTATHDLESVPLLARRVIVLNEDHGVAADGPAEAILSDGDLLLRANLVHEHSRWAQRHHLHGAWAGIRPAR